MKKIKSNPPKTLLTISVGFLFIYLFFEFLWAFYASVSVSLIGVISEKISRLIEKVWFKFAEILGMIIPNIVLFIIFYVFLFPLAFLSKIFKKHTLINLKKNSDTNFVEVKKRFKKEDIIKPF